MVVNSSMRRIVPDPTSYVSKNIVSPLPMAALRIIAQPSQPQRYRPKFSTAVYGLDSTPKPAPVKYSSPIMASVPPSYYPRNLLRPSYDLPSYPRRNYFSYDDLDLLPYRSPRLQYRKYSYDDLDLPNRYRQFTYPRKNYYDDLDLAPTRRYHTHYLPYVYGNQDISLYDVYSNRYKRPYLYDDDLDYPDYYLQRSALRYQVLGVQYPHFTILMLLWLFHPYKVKSTLADYPTLMAAPLSGCPNTSTWKRVMIHFCNMFNQKDILL